jgi:hypothetical protein
MGPIRTQLEPLYSLQEMSSEMRRRALNNSKTATFCPFPDLSVKSILDDRMKMVRPYSGLILVCIVLTLCSGNEMLR